MTDTQKNAAVVERLAYGYELMHQAICQMAGTSGADWRWYYEKANQVFDRVAPVFAVTAESNPSKPGDCLRGHRTLIDASLPTTEQSLAGEVETIERAAVLDLLEERARYFDRTKGHFDRSDTARSYRATAKDIAKLPLIQPAPVTGGEDAPDPFDDCERLEAQAKATDEAMQRIAQAMTSTQDEREARIEHLRSEIGRCDEAIEKGGADNWWYIDRDRFRRELDDLTEPASLPALSPRAPEAPSEREKLIAELMEALEYAVSALCSVRKNYEQDNLLWEDVSRAIKGGNLSITRARKIGGAS